MHAGSNGEIRRYPKPATEQVLKESAITKHLKADRTVGGYPRSWRGRMRSIELYSSEPLEREWIRC